MSAELFQEFVMATFGCNRMDFSTFPTEARKALAGMESLIANMRREGESLIEAQRRFNPKLPPIHLDFIADDKPNAYAFLHKGQRFIGITGGMVGAIWLFLQRMVSDGRILKHIGDPRSCNIHPPLTEPLVDALLEEDRSGRYLVLPPNDPDRLDFQRFVEILAFTFLLTHEFTHIGNGHIDYLNAKSLSPFIAELGWQPTSEEASIELQALEVDADRGAARYVTELVDHWTRNGLVRSSCLKSYEDYLFTALFAMFSLFRVFGDEPLVASDLCKRSHPPFRFRLRAALHGIDEAAGFREGGAIKNLTDIIRKAAMETEHGVHFLTCSPFAAADRYAEASGQVGTDHMKRLMDRWTGGLGQAVTAHGYLSP